MIFLKNCQKTRFKKNLMFLQKSIEKILQMPYKKKLSRIVSFAPKSKLIILSLFSGQNQSV